MDSNVVMKNRSDMNDEGEDGEANSELEARLYAEIYYSNEISDKVSHLQEQYGMTTINDVKNRWRNISNTDQRLETNNLSTNNEVSQDNVDKPQSGLEESPNRCHNIEVSPLVDANIGNWKETNLENINKKMNSKKGHSPKKKKNQNVESVTTESQEETDVSISNRASKEKDKQVDEMQSQCESTTNITNNDNTGDEINKTNKTPKNKQSKICQKQLIGKNKFANKTTGNERIISDNSVPCSLINALEEVTEKTSGSKKQGTSKTKKKNSKNSNVEVSSNITEKETLQKPKKSKKRKKTPKRKNNNNTVPLIILTSSESSDTITETHSKYKVSSKKSKIEQKQSYKNYISSDSDDSILEVPVPPKPSPPLINLQDSDDQCGDAENLPNSPTNSLISNNQLTTEKLIDTTDSESLPSPDSDTNQTVPLTRTIDKPGSTFETTFFEDSNDSQSVGQTIFDDTTLQTNSSEKLPSNAHLTPEQQPIVESEEDTIILNCTGIQKGASSLEEIKKMSGATESKQRSSDYSMTENEANNSGQLAESRMSLNESETARSCVDRVSISENDITAENQKSSRHKKSKSRKRSDNSTKESHDADKENNVSELSGSVTFNFQEGSNNQEANSIDFTDALMEDPEVHPEPAQETSTEKHDLTIIHNQASSKEKSPNRKRSSDTTVSPSTSSKQARYSDAEAGPSNVGLNTPKRKNIQKSSHRNCAADYFFLPMSDELKSFYNESWGGERFDIQQVQSEMPKDPQHWAILDADLCNPTRRQRYWSSQKCKQCHSDGHTKTSCPNTKKDPKCHMCGKEGHTKLRCPDKKCLTCGRTKSSYVKTCEFCRKLKCNTCGSKGHEKSMCPDLWRRYHRTTNTSTMNFSEDNNVVMKPANQLHCCNCARRGHDYTDCVKFRWSEHFPTPSYVTNYTDGPHYINNTENEVIEITDESFVNENTEKITDVNITGEKEPELKEVRCNTLLGQERIIYSYTSRHVIKDPRVWQKEYNGIDKNMRCVMDKGTMPWFIQDVAEIVPLELTISTSTNVYLTFTVRCESKYLTHIERMITMWIDRDEVDKSLIIFKKLPLEKSKMISLLSNKLNEAKVNFGNPLALLSEIKNLKKQIKEFQGNGVYNSQSKVAKSRLIKLECKLVMTLKCQNLSGQLNTQNLSCITDAIDNLRHMKNKIVPTKILLDIMLLYNEFFGQFVPNRAGKLASIKMKHNREKGNPLQILRRNPERAARYDVVTKNVCQKSASISKPERSSTNTRSFTGDTRNLSHTITSDTPIQVPPTFTATEVPNPSILDIHVAPQLLLPLPTPLKNPCNVNFTSNSILIRTDNVVQENFLPLNTAGFPHIDNNPYNVPPQNLIQDGFSTEISNYVGQQYQPFGTLGLPYESHLNNMQGAPHQFCYDNTPQNTIQMNQLPTDSFSHNDIIIDEIVCLGNNQVKNISQSMQMQHQNPPVNMKNTPNTKPDGQPILKSKKARRRERFERKRQKMLLKKNKNNKHNGNTINREMRKNAQFAIQVAKNINKPRLTEAAHELRDKLNTGVMTKKDIKSLNQLILQLSSAENRDK